MATLVCTLSKPLSLADAAGLPPSAVVDNHEGGASVRVEVDGADLAAVVDAAVALGRLLPDATIVVEDDRPVALPATTPAPGQGAERSGVIGGGPARGPVTGQEGAGRAAGRAGGGRAGSDTTDPWELVRQRRFAEVLAVLEGRELDSLGRDVVRELLSSTDPEEVALACDIARITRWRSFVSTMRRKLDHADTRVRIAAVRAIGHLSGPAMIWHLQKLAEDPSPEVRAAVADAIAEIEDRQT